MIGIVLLIIAIFLYIRGNKKWSLLLFVCFMSDGLTLLTDSVISIKNKDLAFTYTIIICIYSFIYERKIKQQDKILFRAINIFFIFLLCSVVFSYMHYGFSFVQILQGGRHHFLFMSYFFLIKTKPEDVKWILHKLFIITFITSILYILQVLTGLPFLSYSLEVRRDASTGLYRYYNSPPLLTLFLYATLLFPDIFKKTFFKKIAPFVLLAALFLTLGRTRIFVDLIVLFLGLLLKGKVSKLIRISLVLGIMLLPFFDVITARFTSNNKTENDLQSIFTGDFKSMALTGVTGDATMSYRFAWVYERISYLRGRPLDENIFGLGMISDSQTDIVQRKYNFSLGLTDNETGYRTQLATPDIAYGNLVTQFGYVGGFISLFIWLRLLLITGERRKEDKWIFCLFLLLADYLLISFAGSKVSTIANLVVPFLLISVLYQSENFYV